MAKVQRKKVGQSLPLTKEDRVGVNEKKERRGSAMQEAKEAQGYKKLIHERGSKGWPLQRETYPRTNVVPKITPFTYIALKFSN
jgi:hypothetical protein